jgi:trans-2,3-dihydro-3-hydroxyanthranilate isomerase
MTSARSLAKVQGLQASKLNTTVLNQVCRNLGTECVMVFTFEIEHPDSTVDVRMFAPLLGAPEDPGTGSANGALGAYLVNHRAVQVTEPTMYIVSEQGAENGRAGKLTIEVESKGDVITPVLVAEGLGKF